MAAMVSFSPLPLAAAPSTVKRNPSGGSPFMATALLLTVMPAPRLSSEDQSRLAAGSSEMRNWFTVWSCSALAVLMRGVSAVTVTLSVIWPRARA